MRSPPTPAAAHPPVGWAAAGLGVLIALAYANSLNAPLVYDDLPAIVDNPTIRHLWPLTDVLAPQAEGGLTVSGRPILNLSFALSYAVSGPAAWGHHVLNLAIHLGATLLLFGLVRRTLARCGGPADPGDAETAEDRRSFPARHSLLLALAIAALWSLHPLQTQAVTYVVQRAESLMGFFYLLTLYALLRAAEAAAAPGPRGPARAWSAVCVGACLLGMGTKEVMATAPLLALLYDRTFLAGSWSGALRARWRLHLALAATWLVLAALVLGTGGNRGGTVGLGVAVPLWAYPLTQFQAVARYLGLALWPHPLVFEYGPFWVQRAGDILPYAALVLPVLALSLLALRRRPALGFLGAWFFGILAPTALAPGTIQMIVEHRPYLPLAGVVTALVLALGAVTGRRAPLVLAALVLAGALLTARRNHDYRSPLALWSDTVAKRPLNPRAHTGLAEALAAAGRVEEAIAARREAVRLLPDESTHHYNLALTLAEAGRTGEAIRHYQLALRLAPGEPRTHNNLAVALGRAGRGPEALVHYATAVRLRPDDPYYQYNYGVALSRAGRPAEAAARYESALRLQPGHADAHFNLAAALVALGRPEAALPHYRAAVQRRPDDAEYREGCGGALLLTGDPRGALAEFRAALALQPARATARYGAGNALAALQQWDSAVAEYASALRAAPELPHGQFKLGTALLALDRPAEAAEALATAVRLAPGDGEAHQNLGVALARLERWADAERAFAAALALNPDDAAARRNLEQVRRLRGR